MSRVFRTGIALVIAGMLWSWTAMLQQTLTKEKPAGWFQERMSYLPSNDHLKPFLMGFETTYANYLWIRTTLYLGGHFLSDQQYPWLVRLVDMVTKLNPRFYPAYEFAGVLLPDLGKDPQASKVILQRGLTNITTDQWKLALYLGTIYLLYDKQKLVAADYFALASRLPGAPVQKLARSAAVFYSQAGEREKGIAFLRMMYETTEDPKVKDHLVVKLNELLATTKPHGSAVLR